MKKYLLLSVMTLIVFISNGFNSSAQIKYQSGKILIGDVQPFSFYSIVSSGTGVYFNTTKNRFFQLDLTTLGAPRLAGHNDQVVFYNTQTGTFNSIQVNKVLNYSDARAKTGVKTLNNGLDIIKELRPVSYNFSGNEARMSKANQFTGYNAEIGLLAQELEGVLPNLVFTDEEGRKLVDYIALIPVLIDAVKSLQQEIEELKSL